MWHRLLFLLPIILSASSIKVPVDKVDNTDDRSTNAQEEHSTPVFYIEEGSGVDSYLVPPDPNKPETDYSDILATPATYLIPPVKQQRSDFYAPVGVSVQSDWLPIAQVQPHTQRNPRFQRPLIEPIPILFDDATHQRDGGQFTIPIPIPSTQLLPPSVDAVNEYFTSEGEQNQPRQVPNLPIYKDDSSDAPAVRPLLESAEPTLALHLIPPKLQQPFKLPTKLYPKKYSSDFKPVPIPLSQFSLDNESQVPYAKPAKFFKPQPSDEVEDFTAVDEKNLYHYKKAEHKRKLKGEDDSKKQHYDEAAAAETHGEPTSTEQETSETNFRYPGRNRYPAPLRQAHPSVSPRDASSAAVPAPDGRTEFRMHGMKGPHSYQFGYDTGKGKNRQFRYEERDNEGLVHGHYGYMDKLGKLRVVNYSAHPEHGFRAEEPVEKEQ